eukprot:TRINITY_DN43523_c0_g1_i2.p1 TRINITY_DN43523_c0_g1~~TRINITY_DN43523_c0_g1_i2.p1  ORF type:complete len:563 (+),score=123.82 TRINITY_DN43523_c0_g1_i2:255-1943(+)
MAMLSEDLDRAQVLHLCQSLWQAQQDKDGLSETIDGLREQLGSLHQINEQRVDTLVKVVEVNESLSETVDALRAQLLAAQSTGIAQAESANLIVEEAKAAMMLELQIQNDQIRDLTADLIHGSESAANFVRWSALKLLTSRIHAVHTVMLARWFFTAKCRWGRCSGGDVSPLLSPVATPETSRPVHVVLFSELGIVTNNWDPERIIGRGGFGPVYSAEWRDTDVAIKVLEESSAQGDQEFMREMSILGTCQSDFIVPLLAIALDDTRRCLVYQLMPGGSLQDRLNDERNRWNGPILWQCRVKAVWAASCGLMVLHKNRQLHRDIKSANILLDADGNAALCDVGLARKQLGTSTWCHTMKVAGTPGYIDPEFASTMSYGEWSDIFGLGVVLLEIVTGQRAMLPGGKTLLTQCEDVCDDVDDKQRQGIGAETNPLLLSATLLADSRGHWPLPAAATALKLGLRCCYRRSKQRPSLLEITQVLYDLLRLDPVNSEETDQMRVHDKCVSCLQQPKAARLYPCMHAVTCATCAKKLCETELGCPVCGTIVSSYVEGEFMQTVSQHLL